MSGPSGFIPAAEVKGPQTPRRSTQPSVKRSPLPKQPSAKRSPSPRATYGFKWPNLRSSNSTAERKSIVPLPGFRFPPLFEVFIKIPSKFVEWFTKVLAGKTIGKAMFYVTQLCLMLLTASITAGAVTYSMENRGRLVDLAEVIATDIKNQPTPQASAAVASGYLWKILKKSLTTSMTSLANVKDYVTTKPEPKPTPETIADKISKVLDSIPEDTKRFYGLMLASLMVGAMGAAAIWPSIRRKLIKKEHLDNVVTPLDTAAGRNRSSKDYTKALVPYTLGVRVAAKRGKGKGGGGGGGKSKSKTKSKSHSRRRSAN